MKKLFLIAITLLMAGVAQAKQIAESLTSTANGVNQLNTTLNAPFGVGVDGNLHRLATDNSGNVSIVNSGASSVTDTSGNSASAVALPQEDITAYNSYSLVSYTVTAVNLSTTVGSTCPLGISWWLGSPSASIFFMVGDLTFTPAVSQMAAGLGDQLAANALPIVAPYPAYSGTKLFMVGNGAAATESLKTGKFKIK